MDAYEVVRRFILESLLGPGDAMVLDRDTLLRESGVLDSLSTLKLLSFLEEHFAIQFVSEEIDTEQFASLRQIEEMIRTKQTQQGAAQSA